MKTDGWVGSFQNLSEYWTTCSNNQTEKRLIYIVDHVIWSVLIMLWFLQKHRYVNNESFVLRTPLLTCVSYVVTEYHLINAINKFMKLGKKETNIEFLIF